MPANLRKWLAVFSVSLQDTLAYRASMVIWILTDLTTAITMPLVWAAAGKGAIQGMAVGDITLYYLAMLQIGAFVTSHMMWDIATEIREGIFTVYLVRPISFYQFEFWKNLSWRVVRSAFTAPFLIAFYLLYRPLIGDATLVAGWELWVAILLGHLVSFSLVMALGTLALFVQEAHSIFELYYVPMIFLSGYLVPVHMLPDWAHALSKVLPFYYTTGVPTEIAVGRLSGGDAHQALLIQVAWVLAHYALGRAFWRLGLRHYTAVGM
jgi:ABC-2 type transport system permease protein